ncbi:SGNH/GDSL hydrolase family protein [Streptacidiphilus sp. EB129]|uniref:SGNH/GDSL hydrolase family protein n=1 Tax=Streptacidiphilus sp. EB129 TaxID=3156262 RepID=UPI0035135ED7
MPSTSPVRKALAAGAMAALAVAGLSGTASAQDSQSGGSQSAGRHHEAHYYVSLGDSLAAGYQPNVRTNTNVSYTDQLYAKLKQHDPSLVHIKLGCSGETTETMINGGICSYPGASSQLDAAEKFLRTHRGQVQYLTIDIGANDVDGCLSPTGIDLACTAKGVATVAAQLPGITRGLYQAGGPRVRYAGMNYYDPFLAVWLTGPAGQQLAQESTGLSTVLNGVIKASLRAGHFALADASTAYSTNDFKDQVTLPGLGPVPLNVARICEWTWECTPYHDIHANPTGHAVLAEAFEDVLRHHD